MSDPGSYYEQARALIQAAEKLAGSKTGGIALLVSAASIAIVFESADFKEPETALNRFVEVARDQIATDVTRIWSRRGNAALH